MDGTPRPGCCRHPARLLAFDVPPGDASFMARRITLPEERLGWLISMRQLCDFSCRCHAVRIAPPFPAKALRVSRDLPSGGAGAICRASMLTLEILLVLGLVLLNGVLAMSELAIVSSRPGRLKAMRDRGVPGARTALMLAESPGRFLSTVQVGITLVGILAGAFSGAALGDRLSTWFVSLGMPANYAEPMGFLLVIAAITYVSLVIGELVPKQWPSRTLRSSPAGWPMP